MTDAVSRSEPRTAADPEQYVAWVRWAMVEAGFSIRLGPDAQIERLADLIRTAVERERVEAAAPVERGEAALREALPGWLWAQYRDLHDEAICRNDAHGCRCPCHGEWGRVLALAQDEGGE